MSKPTAEDVKAYREEHQIGMADAKRILDRRWREERLRAVRDKLRHYDGGATVTVEMIEILIDILLELP